MQEFYMVFKLMSSCSMRGVCLGVLSSPSLLKVWLLFGYQCSAITAYKMSCQARKRGLLPPLSGWLLANMVPWLHVLLNNLWLSLPWSWAAVLSWSQHQMPEKGGKRSGERMEGSPLSWLGVVLLAMSSLSVGCLLITFTPLSSSTSLPGHWEIPEQGTQ